MIVYADTSALAKLVLEEAGSADMRATFDSAETVGSAAIAYVELRAVMAAAIRDRRMHASRDQAVLAVEQMWDRVSEIALDRLLLRDAGDLAERMRLRGYDAVHLAALRQMGIAGEVTFACWDGDLRRAAQEMGYALVPG